MAEVNYTLIFGVVFGIMGAITATWSIIMRMLWSSFSKHKETVQYKDNCKEISAGIKEKIEDTKELLETKFENLNDDIVEIKDLIKNNGRKPPRIRT